MIFNKNRNYFNMQVAFNKYLQQFYLNNIVRYNYINLFLIDDKASNDDETVPNSLSILKHIDFS